MSQRMLMIVHAAHSSCGRIGAGLEARGYVLDKRCPMAGDTLPERLEPFAGCVVFGGPMSANDDTELPGLAAELEWIPAVLEAGVPFLGVCLGAQLLARTLGARVAPHPEGLGEIGYYELVPARCGDSAFPRRMHVYHWHTEGFDLPDGAELLAGSDTFPHQAYRYGERTYGIQFHPEVTLGMMREWLSEAPASLSHAGAQSAEAHLRGYRRHDRALGAWLDGFLDQWLRVGDDRRAAVCVPDRRVVAVNRRVARRARGQRTGVKS